LNILSTELTRRALFEVADLYFALYFIFHRKVLERKKVSKKLRISAARFAKTFASLFNFSSKPLHYSTPVVIKMGGIAPVGAILRSRRRKKQKGRQGAKQHKKDKNAQPLIDHCVNFSILFLWLVGFLQILIYYSLEVVAKAIYLLNFNSGLSMRPPRAVVLNLFCTLTPNWSIQFSVDPVA